MKAYTLSPAYMIGVKKRLLVVALLFIAALPLITWLIIPAEAVEDVLVWTLPLMASVLAIGLFRGHRLQRRLWSSYTLTIDPDRIRLTQRGLGDTSIANEEITRISEGPSGGLLVTAAPGREIFIPASLERYAEARATLSAIREIEPGHPSQWRLVAAILAPILPAVATFLVARSEDLYIVAGVGGSLCMLIISGLIHLWTRQDVPAVVKKGLWVYLIPVGMIVLRVVMLVIVGSYRE